MNSKKKLTIFEKIWIFTLIGIFTILGTIPAILVINDGVKILMSQNWEKTKAKTQKIEWQSHEESAMEGEGTAYVQRVKIDYEYEIEGQKYTSSQVAFGYVANSIEPHYDLFLKLEESPNFYIYVNPNNPNETVIFRGLLNYHIFMILASIAVLSLIGVIFFAGFLKIRGKRIFIIAGFVVISWGLLLTLAFNENLRISLADKIEVAH